jgi:hypothetical protein
MGRFLSGCLMAIGAAVVVIVVGGILLSHRTSSTNSSSGSTSDQPAQQPPFSITRGNITYYGTISSDVGVAVLGLRDAGPYLPGGFEELIKADGKFIVVAVAISNRQNTAITMNASLFEILDSGGNVYSASEKSMEVGTSNDLFLAQINPGVIKTGLILFDVPQTLSLDSLRLRFRGGMMGDSAILPLKVDSVERPVPSAPAAQPSANDQPDIQYPTAQPVPADGSQPTAPTTVSIGQTPSEVEAILGQPVSVTTGAKHVYTYPHVTVLFVDGKVSEIHNDQPVQ